ncbi:MAG: cation diffusion facilitator family transporter [Bacteroidales bacterium]
MNKKEKTARPSIFSYIFLITIKLVAGIMSGLVSILSEAVHSMREMIAANVAYFSVRIASQPPDKEHPCGHGKFENVSGGVQGLLISLAALWIIYESIGRYVNKEEIGFFILGFLVMLFSAIVNIFVSKRLYKVAHETDSIALEADVLHPKTNVYKSLGVAIGILIIWITGFHFLDPSISIAVALLIFYEAFLLTKKTYTPLLDGSLPDQDIKKIELVLNKYTGNCFQYHRIRTRKSGLQKHLDFHLEVPDKLNVREAHDLCDNIDKGTERKHPVFGY